MSTSQQLHDEGEESWALKLHIGAGGVYLRGYVNSDIDGVIALNRPDMIKWNVTDITDYYARLDGDMNNLPAPRQTVVDLVCDATKLPYKHCAVDKILAVQLFEHLTPAQANKALVHWRGLLRFGGPLVMSVPDTLATFDLMATNQTFAMRHLRGSNRNPHYAWYTRETLTELLESSGFSVEHLPNFHFYPALVVRAIKR